MACGVRVAIDAGVCSLFLLASASVVRAQSAAAGSDDDHAIVFELGWAGDWSHDEAPSEGCGVRLRGHPLNTGWRWNSVLPVRADGVTECRWTCCSSRQFSKQFEFGHRPSHPRKRSQTGT